MSFAVHSSHGAKPFGLVMKMGLINAKGLLELGLRFEDTV